MVLKRLKYQIKPECDLKEYIEIYQIVNISIGNDNCYYVLTVNDIQTKVDGISPHIQTTSLKDYRIIVVQSDNTYTIDIVNQPWDYYFVQPIGPNRILLASARSKYYDQDNYDLNGKIFDWDGNLIKEFLLGDGIQDLTVSGRNIIWTSYFDEGVFGNYGWDDPVGSCGLSAWNEEGEQVYTYSNSGDNFICDCYALNVVNDKEVWFYYYSDFLLGRINGEKIDYYNPIISGSDGFVIYNKYILFRGGYNKRDEYHLYEFEKGDKLKEKKSLIFKDENNEIVKADNISCKGSKMILRVDTRLYSVDLKELVGEL